MADAPIAPKTGTSPGTPGGAAVAAPGGALAPAYNYKAILQAMVQQNASDLHLKVGRAPTLRARAVAGLGHLGLAIDASANAAGNSDRDVSDAGARAHVLVVEAREDLEIAREVRSLLAGRGRGEP